MIEEPTFEEIREVMCPNLRKAKMVCISSNCKENAFICLQQSCQSCESKHSLCQCYRLNSMIVNIVKKRKKITPKIQQSIKTLQKIYDEAIQRLSRDKQGLQDLKDMFGLHQHEATFIRMVQDGCHSEITGKLTSTLIPTLNIQHEFNADIQGIQRFWVKRKKQFESIFDKFKELPSKKISKFESKITDDVDTIEQFLDKPVGQYKLLYRASENNFDVTKFHQKCDDIANTLVIAKTEYGRIVGGYTPLKWNSYSTNYIQDHERKTFLFSLSLKQKYENTSIQHSIYCNPAYGPTFGGGHDMYIANNSATAQNTSYCNFGHSYNLNGKYRSGQAHSYQQFSGSTTGQYYARFTEWEVYQIQFL